MAILTLVLFALFISVVVALQPIRVINGTFLSESYGIAFDVHGNVIVSNSDYNFANTLCLLTPHGRVIEQWGYGLTYTPEEIATDHDGFLYVNLANSKASLLKVNISSREIVAYWQLQFKPIGLAVDPVHRWVYVGVFGSPNVAKLSALDGTLIQTLNVNERIMSVTVDRNSDLYVSTQANHIVKLNNSGHIFAVYNTSSPSLSYPFGMIVTRRTDHLIVADYDNHRLVEFNHGGAVVRVIDVEALYPRLMALQHTTDHIFLTANNGGNAIYVFSLDEMILS